MQKTRGNCSKRHSSVNARDDLDAVEVVVHSVVDAVDNATDGAAAEGAQHTDVEDRGVLGNAVGVRADGAGAVGAVALRVVLGAAGRARGAEERVAVSDERGTAAEVGVAGVHTATAQQIIEYQ